jgi:toxin ParE1/3/4
VAAIRVSEKAAARIDSIYAYTLEAWGSGQAEIYLNGLFEAFAGIETGAVLSRPIPAEFGVDGFYFRYEKHFVYWKWLVNGDIGIVTVLHERMHRIGRLKDEFGV